MKKLLWFPFFLALLASASATELTGSIGGGSGGGGSGTVTNIATSCGVSGGPITTTGTISGITTVNPETGANYPIVSGDCGKLINLSNAAPQIPTIPSGTTLGAGWFTEVCNQGAGTQTITPAAGTIGGAATFVLAAGTAAAPKCTGIVSDGTNLQLDLAVGGGGASGANPSATASDTAVNGAASTFMRSDGAPAIQKATNAQFGLVEVDGTTIAVTAGVISGWKSISAYKSSNWYPSLGIPQTAAAGAANVASTVYCHPFVIGPQGVTIKGLGVVIPTITVGNVSVAIYKADGTGGRPSTFIDAIASQSTNANPASGTVINTTDALIGGMYWTCSSTDNTTVRFNIVPTGGGGMYAVSFIGSATLTSALHTSNNVAGLSCTAASTCGGTFAAWSGATFTWSSLSAASWTEVTTTIVPQVVIQAN